MILQEHIQHLTVFAGVYHNMDAHPQLHVEAT